MASGANTNPRRRIARVSAMGVALAALSGYCLYSGLDGSPMIGRQTHTKFELWRAHGPGAYCADSYLYYAAAVSFATLLVALIVLTIRPLPRESDAVPRWLAPPQWAAWIIALAAILWQWLSGARYSNFTPASDDLLYYVTDVVLAAMMIALFVFLRIVRIREIRAGTKAARARSGRARTPRA